MARILVIDDNEAVRKMIGEILRRNGYEVMEAPDGKIGLSMYAENPADVVITDIFKPEKEGLETIMELRRGVPDARIIAMTGGIGALDRETTLLLACDLGADKTIMKPVPRAELLAAIEELLQRP